jgi:hypothetical protein
VQGPHSVSSFRQTDHRWSTTNRIASELCPARLSFEPGNQIHFDQAVKYGCRNLTLHTILELNLNPHIALPYLRNPDE